MTDSRIIRSWKDDAFRLTLNDTERASLPSSPVGAIELDDADLADMAGGAEAGLTQGTVCATGFACVTVVTIAISKNMSCGACDVTLWSGSCAVSSIGCCPAAF